MNAERFRVRLGQAHEPKDKQGSLAYLTRCLDDSCGKRRRAARPAKKRHKHSTRSDQSECGVSPYGTILRTKHGKESWALFVVWNYVSLSLLLYHCSCPTDFLFVFRVLNAGVGWWRCFYGFIHARYLTREMLTYNTYANNSYSSRLLGSASLNSNTVVHCRQAVPTSQTTSLSLARPNPDRHHAIRVPHHSMRVTPTTYTSTCPPPR